MARGGMLLVVLGLGLLALATGPAKAAETVVTRAGAHPGFGRIVFNWSQPTAYRAGIEDGRLVIRFARPISTGFDAVIEHLDDYISTAALSEDGRTAVFRLVRPFDLRQRLDGAHIVIDLVELTPGAGSETETEQGDTLLRVRAGKHPGFDRLVFDWPEAVGYRLESAEARATIRFDRPAKPDFTRLARARLRYVRKPAVIDGGGPLTVRLALESGSRVRHFRYGTFVVIDIFAPSGTQQASADTDAAAPFEPAPKADRRPDPKAETPGAPTPLVMTSADPGRVFLAATAADGRAEVRFAWNEAVAAASFRRAGHLWLVFDRPAPDVDLEVLRIAGLVRSAERVRADGATVLRLVLEPGIGARLRREGTTWLAALGAGPAAPALAVPTQTRISTAGGPGLWLGLQDAGDPIRLIDPGVGDRIVVVPTGAAGLGVAARRRYPEFELPQTTQGLVVVPYSEHLRIESARDGVTIGGPDGLVLSVAADTERETATAGETDYRARSLFGYADWSGEPSFIAAKHRLQGTIVVASAERIGEARLDLARLYFAHGLPTDALGQLSAIAREDPELADRLPNRALRGAVQYLTGDHQAAARSLADPAFDRDPEIALWRGATAAARADAATAARDFVRGAERLASLPALYRHRLGMAAAGAALEAGDGRQAGRFLDLVETTAPEAATRSMMETLRGRIDQLEGRPEDALARWDVVLAGTHRAARTRAALWRVAHLRETGRMTADDAIAALDGMRFGWRGDGLEFALLRDLGHLYLEAGRTRDGLETLRTAATYFAAHPEVPAVAQEMKQAFAALFLDDGEEIMPAVSALALYEDFSELTPSGPQGERVVKNLTRRLVAVDLLDQAAALLDEQVRFRLDGAEKAAAGAELATVHLLDHDPAAALDALDASAVAALPTAVVAERLRIRARALTELDRAAEALAILADDASPEAALVRFEVHWRTGDWVGAAETLARVVDAIDAGARPLAGARDELVLRWAVSLALADDRPGLDALARRFGVHMASGPHAAVFRLATQPFERLAVALPEEAARLGDVSAVLAVLRGEGAEAAEGDVAAKL